ncbi:MAG TPA: 2Fe-2S iron-sulfur cluster binding domain-containing protein [Pseudolabrys sp.]|nr:2Fe-2S iron-sulfur cluster binding domain-containing protein [Pseudolabrys sp.]
MKITVESKSGTCAFDCSGKETLLRAGLRQGFGLPYECATGTCGTCRARLMSGSVEVGWREAPGAKKLKPDKGDVLMCQTRPRSDCVLRVPSEIATGIAKPPRSRRGVIRDIRALTGDVAHFDLHLSEPMDFQAGQFVVLETEDLAGGRAYSMVNFDDSVDKLALVLKRKPAGGFSEWLFGHRNGEVEVEVFGPLGRAVFHPDDGKDIVCIAGGSGIAGMMSILEHAVRVDHFGRFKGAVFFGVRTLADAFYLEELARYVAVSRGNLEVTVALSHAAAATSTCPNYPLLKLASGMVHEVAARAMEGRCGDVTAYVAGPPVMVDAAIRAMIVSGAAPSDIRYDKFG